VSLAVGGGTGIDGHLSARLDPRNGGLESTGAHNLGRPEGADLHITGKAYSAQLALLAELRRLSLELFEAGNFHRLVERHRVIAAVVVQAHRGLVRELVLLDE